MADLQTQRLEPALGGGLYFFYPQPNPALTEILIGMPLQGIVGDWTAKVLATYVGRLGDRPHKGDPHPGLMAEATRPEVFIGGYKHDRWIGQITVGVEYASADEFGRDAYNPYAGHHDLRDALLQNLPRI